MTAPRSHVPLAGGPHAGVLVDPALCDPSAPPIDQFAGEWAFLSNFHPAVLTWDGTTWPTSEHAFNAGKTLDPAVRAWIRDAPDPGQAKRRGTDRSKVALRPGWDSTVRYQVMAEVLSAKFRADPRRQAALLSTGSRPLVEGTTWHDNHWGSCRCGTRPACAEPGLNHLGDQLMALRWALACGM